MGEAKDRPIYRLYDRPEIGVEALASIKAEMTIVSAKLLLTIVSNAMKAPYQLSSMQVNVDPAKSARLVSQNPARQRLSSQHSPC